MLVNTKLKVYFVDIFASPSLWGFTVFVTGLSVVFFRGPPFILLFENVFFKMQSLRDKVKRLNDVYLLKRSQDGARI